MDAPILPLRDAAELISARYTQKQGQTNTQKSWLWKYRLALSWEEGTILYPEHMRIDLWLRRNTYIKNFEIIEVSEPICSGGSRAKG